MVTVYTQPNCQPCRATKKRMEKLGIPFNEVDITSDPSALDTLRAEGWQSAPVVKTQYETWGGFNPSKIDALAS